MQLPARLVEFVFKPIDLLPQLVAVAPITIAIPIRALVFAPQPFDLALLSLQLFDQFLTRRRGPSRLHAPVMARLKNLYKYRLLDSAGRRRSITAVTR
jgi:hypothetical protein